MNKYRLCMYPWLFLLVFTFFFIEFNVCENVLIRYKCSFVYSISFLFSLFLSLSLSI